MNKSDVIVIGAGIAGASIAAELGKSVSVTLLEMEDAAGYHSSGRSAASWVPSYGPEIIRVLTQLSGPFFKSPPEGFCETDLLSPLGEMMIAQRGQEDDLAQEISGPSGFKEISLAQAKGMVPELRLENITAAALDAEALAIDVDLLLQGYLRQFKANGGILKCKSEATDISKKSGEWHVTTANGIFTAPKLVNAAGAWGDVVSGMAGGTKCGLIPKRRSAALIPVEGHDLAKCPLVFGCGETFYFRPMGGMMMVSPADATPVEPHDAWADDMLLAEAIEQFQNVYNTEVTKMPRTWGGLRSFVPDGDPVAGYDPKLDGFFLLIGQGGYGIQTAPALSKLGAAMVLGNSLPYDIDTDRISPNRF